MKNVHANVLQTMFYCIWIWFPPDAGTVAFRSFLSGLGPLFKIPYPHIPQSETVDISILLNCFAYGGSCAVTG